MKKIEELFKQWHKKRDQSSWDEILRLIWENYHQKLQVYIRQLSPSFDDIPGITSDILIKIFESLEKYNTKYSFSTWIYCVARNFFIDRGRKKKLLIIDSAESEPLNCETPETITMEKEVIHQVQQAISELKPAERELIYLNFYEGLKYTEISRITGRPVGTIKYQMSQCRKKLGVSLKEQL